METEPMRDRVWQFFEYMGKPTHRGKTSTKNSRERRVIRRATERSVQETKTNKANLPLKPAANDSETMLRLEVTRLSRRMHLLRCLLTIDIEKIKLSLYKGAHLLSRQRQRPNVFSSDGRLLVPVTEVHVSCAPRERKEEAKVEGHRKPTEDCEPDCCDGSSEAQRRTHSGELVQEVPTEAEEPQAEPMDVEGTSLLIAPTDSVRTKRKRRRTGRTGPGARADAYLGAAPLMVVVDSPMEDPTSEEEILEAQTLSNNELETQAVCEIDNAKKADSYEPPCGNDLILGALLFMQQDARVEGLDTCILPQEARDFMERARRGDRELSPLVDASPARTKEGCRKMAVVRGVLFDLCEEMIFLSAEMMHCLAKAGVMKCFIHEDLMKSNLKPTLLGHIQEVDSHQTALRQRLGELQEVMLSKVGVPLPDHPHWVVDHLIMQGAISLGVGQPTRWGGETTVSAPLS